MATLQVRSPELPWNDSDKKNFRLILILLLGVVLAIGIIVPNI